MAFFGVTRHGSYSPLLDKQPACRPAPFGKIPGAEYEKAFDKYLMGDSAQARALQVRP
jgi:hypothetical protein